MLPTSLTRIAGRHTAALRQPVSWESPREFHADPDRPHTLAQPALSLEPSRNKIYFAAGRTSLPARADKPHGPLQDRPHGGPVQRCPLVVWGAPLDRSRKCPLSTLVPETSWYLAGKSWTICAALNAGQKRRRLCRAGTWCSLTSLYRVMDFPFRLQRATDGGLAGTSQREQARRLTMLAPAADFCALLHHTTLRWLSEFRTGWAETPMLVVFAALVLASGNDVVHWHPIP